MPDYPHFLLSQTSISEDYTAKGGGGGDFKTPPRDGRKIHGKTLIKQFQDVRRQAETELKKVPATDELDFIPVTFQGEIKTADGKELDGLKLESLETKDEKLRIINVRVEGNKQFATVAIAKDKVEYLAKRINDYIAKDRAKKEPDGSLSKKPYHKDLIESISEIRLAVLKDCYTDSDCSVPDVEKTIWWETWLETRGDDKCEDHFRSQAETLGIQLSKETVRFPEAIVILARTSLEQWSQFPGLLNHLTELRRAKIVASEFLALTPSDQGEYIQDFLDRIQYAPLDAPAVCILDTGVYRGHPLLEKALHKDDAQAWRSTWMSADRRGHGTGMSGIALFGPDLGELLNDGPEIQLEHRLESVKIIPDKGNNRAPDYGPFTVGSVALAELKSPHRKRVFCLAITADGQDEWRPDLWSSYIDEACSGVLDNYRRSVCISAGNISVDRNHDYPKVNHSASIQSPAQSWNAITVGAYTSKAIIKEKKYKNWTPIASNGRLSPESTTSFSWAKEWPIKPEIVLEGGNWAQSPDGVTADLDDLAILTTQLHDDRDTALLGAFQGTSPAAAQAARMAAIIQANYPDYWPETIRGILIHSASWTKGMKEEFPVEKNSNGNKKIPWKRLRCYGWGVPHLNRAIQCGQHIATMVIQDSLQPFCMKGKEVKTKNMDIHRLPLPSSVIQDLGKQPVRMRVTLSYFIEPSPSRKSLKTHHRYASHGLRFDVKRPTESLEEFKKQLSSAFWEGPKIRPGRRDQEDRHWVIGSYGRTKGSVHSDWWIGTASQLAASEFIGIYPVTGWWRERPSQNCYEKKARYSLIVTIQTKDTKIELYNAVAQEIKLATQLETEIEIT